MKNELFENFILQRKMYFDVCKITNYGEYYFSLLIKDSDWNYFIPYDMDAIVNNFDEIKRVFDKQKRKLCFAIPSYINNVNKITSYLRKESMNKIGSENWLSISNKKDITKVNCKYKVVNNDDDLNLFKYILTKTYSNPASIIQPYGNLNKEYLTKIENMGLNKDSKNIILFKENEAIAACTLCIDDDVAGIYNLAILPKYQENEYGYNVILSALNEFKKIKAITVYIQINNHVKLYEWLINHKFNNLFDLSFYS